MPVLNGVHVVTDAQLAPGRDHLDIARAAVETGAPVLQLRDKLLPDAGFYEIADAKRKLTKGTGTLFLVNDRVDIALAVGADGVHVGQSDLPAPLARRLVGANCILGVSASSIAEAVRATADGADYVGYGPVFSTATKNDAASPTGVRQLAEMKSMVSAPVVAIGGIGESNIASVVASGADGVAVISAVVCAEDMCAAITRLSDLFRGAAEHDDGYKDGVVRRR